MPAFTLSKDVCGVLRMQRRAYPELSQGDQMTLELGMSVYGHLVQRKEALSAPEFLQRIRDNYKSDDRRQAEIERVVELCFDHWAHSAQTQTQSQDGEGQGLAFPASTGKQIF